jgi:hypothetical protein
MRRAAPRAPDQPIRLLTSQPIPAVTGASGTLDAGAGSPLEGGRPYAIAARSISLAFSHSRWTVRSVTSNVSAISCSL